MRTEFPVHRPHRPAMATVFAFVLVAAFFAFAPRVQACQSQSQIAITKIETGAGAPGGTYDITMTGADFSATVAVAAGATVYIDEVPPGTYVLSEAGGTADTTIVPNPVVVTNDHDGQTIDVVVTNPFPAGRLAIDKVATGDTAPDVDYTFDITGPDDTTLTATVTTGDTWTSDWLPLGTYTITERDAPAGHTITPNPVELTEDGTTVTVTATNPYRDFHGKLAITKVIPADPIGSGSYRIDVTGPETFTITLSNGETWTSDWLPLGTYTITEPDGPAGHTISPNPVVLSDDEVTVTVTVTNPSTRSGVSANTLPATGMGATGLLTLAGAMIAIGAVAITSTKVAAGTRRN